LIVAVAKNTSKNPLFSIDKRIKLINEAINANNVDNNLIYAEAFDNLLIDFAKTNEVSIIIRGLRVVSDFDYEFQMAGMNKRLNTDIETVFLMASETNQFIASRFVKEVASLGGDVSSFVPDNVNNEIIKKFNLIK
jgi:pantetheine-phosphate adenylyltransferase